MADNQTPNNPNNQDELNDPYRSEMPQYSSGYGSTPGGYTLDDEQELDSGMSSVAASQGRMLFVMGGGLLVIAVVLYALFSGDDSSTAQKTTDAPINTASARNSVAPAGQTPPPPSQPLPVPPPPPVAPPVTPPAPPPPPPVPDKVTRIEGNTNQQQVDRSTRWKVPPVRSRNAGDAWRERGGRCWA